MEVEEHIIEDSGVKIEPYDGDYRQNVLYVESAVIKFNDEEHTVELDEEVEWDEARKLAMVKLAQNRLEKKRREKELAPAEGNSKFSVSDDTKVFRTLLVVGYLQPVPTDVVGDVLSHNNPSSMIGNATYRDLVQAVAEEGNTHYYSLTPEGWKQIIAVEGVEGWRSAAEELLSNYSPQSHDDEEEQTGLAAFGYDGDE